MAEDTITEDFPAELTRNLGDLERVLSEAETKGRPRELKSLEPVQLDTSEGVKATRGTYKKLKPGTGLRLGELKCLTLPAGTALDKFKEQQKGLKRDFVCDGKAFVNDKITGVVVFRPES